MDPVIPGKPQEVDFDLENFDIQYQVGQAKAKAEMITSMGVIATFLAAVEAGLLSLTYQNNSKTVEKIINISGFLAIGFEVLGACIGIMGARETVPNEQAILQAVQQYKQVVEDLSQIKKELEKLNGEEKQLKAEGSAEEYSRLSDIENERKGLEKRQGEKEKDRTSIEPQIRGMCKWILYNVGTGSTGIGVMLYGIVSFFISFICFLVDSQPKSVWIPALGVGVGLYLWQLGNEFVFQHFIGGTESRINQMMNSIVGEKSEKKEV